MNWIAKKTILVLSGIFLIHLMYFLLIFADGVERDAVLVGTWVAFKQFWDIL